MKSKSIVPAVVFACGMALALASTSIAQTSDFDSRCAEVGVVNCVGFDNERNDIVRGENLHPDGDGTYRAFLDRNVKTSGDGSLRFDLPPPPHSGANIAGRWSPVNDKALGRLFGQNTTFYVQFQQRFSEGMLNNTWNSSWKTVIFHQDQITCGGIEITTQNRYLTNLPILYTNCGEPAMYTTLNGARHTDEPPMLLQQGDYNCQYSRESNATCFYFPQDEWVTFYYKISLGTWDQPDSMVEMWIARQGSGQYEQVIRVPGMPLTCNANSCTGAGASEGYDNITFTPYMTDLGRNSGRAGIVSSTWIDELIVSTRPIAPPNVGIRPSPPASLDAQ